ncbi:hypothetical protein PMAYCL1PPCAC_15664, partial [Pristionchus mayeri]
IADIPDYMDKVTPWMLVLIAVGLFFDRKNYAFNDTATSVMTGVLYFLCKFSGSISSITVYIAVYEKVHIIDLDIYNPWLWLMAFLAQDLIYYLGHRAMHEWGILWAFHELHHSSEYYNFRPRFESPLLCTQARVRSISCKPSSSHLSSSFRTNISISSRSSGCTTIMCLPSVLSSTYSAHHPITECTMEEIHIVSIAISAVF